MAATFKLNKKEFPVRDNTTIRKTIEKLGFSPSAYLILKNGQLVTDDEMIGDGDIIELVKVISGG